MSLNKRNFNPGGTTSGPGPVVHSYGSSDTIATIEGAGYFNDLYRALKTGDLLYVYSSAATSTGGSKLYVVTVSGSTVSLSTGTAIS